MKLKPENFSIRPLFYDALSAEFTPAIDPQGRAHTLGRLSVAAVSKGSFSVNRENDEHFPLFTYKPSWAEGVRCQVDSEWIDPKKVNALMWGIHLRNEQGNAMYVFSPNAHEMQIWGPDADRAYSLRQGRSLEICREAVQVAAQKFFDPQPQ